MGIAGVGYRPNDTYYRHTNSRTGRYAESQAAAQNVTQADTINLNWSDGAIFASGTPDGQSFSIYKADGYSTENPLMLIKGIDKNGEAYEQQVNPLTVDPTNASFAEIMAVNAYFVDIGELNVNDMGAFERPSDDDLEKADYLTALRQWRDTQYDAGNIVGYHKAANVCNALINLQQEQNGTEKYITGLSGETVRAVAIEGRLKSGIAGFSSVGQGDNLRLLEARYADNSTSENPVIEVRISKENGETQIFQMNINDIDPRNASQMEMFALLSHADAQGISEDGLDKSSYMKYLECAGQAGMEADSAEDFINKKQDWTQMKDSIASDSETDSNRPEYKWVELLNHLFDYFIGNLSDELSDSGIIMDMVAGEDRYPVKNSAFEILQEEDGFSVTDKETGNTCHYKDTEAQLLKDTESGVTYLINVDENNRVTEKLEVSDQLLADLNVFFMTNHIKPGEMSQDIRSQIAEITQNESEEKQSFSVDENVETTAAARGSSLMRHLSGEDQAPYSYLAKDGVIEYNGVAFNCDYERNRITLGDVSNPKNCLNIPLSKGGSLVVNVDNLGDLSKAIGMFSPEDIRRIMEAIAQYNKAKEMEQEIEEDTNSIGDSATERMQNTAPAEQSEITDSNQSQVAPLVSESTRSTDHSEEKEKLYITWYNEDGIFCREQGQTEGYLWSVPLNGKDEYDKVMSFLGHFGQDENLQFAHDENFWKEFLVSHS